MFKNRIRRKLLWTRHFSVLKLPCIVGEEMDFLELLKSFGLDMGSVASALGIDMAALNNMDQEVLLHLLTSQTSQNNN
jgi:hypothetical protein